VELAGEKYSRNGDCVSIHGSTSRACEAYQFPGEVEHAEFPKSNLSIPILTYRPFWFRNYKQLAKASLWNTALLLGCGLPMTELNVYDEVVTRRPTLPKNLLIVEHEETSRERCATVAAPAGLRAASGSSAELALEVLEHSAVDITSSGP
jgi:hypothetical protein